MIKGLTHDTETGVMNSMVKYKGKISTGWQPNEGPNKKNAPAAAGFFRFMKQVVKTKKVNNLPVPVQEWILNEIVQKKLQEVNNASETPRRIECMCMDRTPDEMWESYLGKFSGSDGLVCKSHGEGTVPTEVYYEGDKRLRRPRLFNGQPACPYKECPDFKKNACKEIGVLKVYPMVDLSINPYQLTTRSLNTIASVEYALRTMYNAAMAAWKLRCIQTGKTDTKFDGLMGIKFILVHRKIKSGGRDVFVTQIEHSEEFSSYVMKTIQQGIEAKQQKLLEGGTGSVIEPALMIESQNDDESDAPEQPSLLSPDEEKEVATDFVADADKAKTDGALNAAAAKLLKSEEK
jgi:hypothetical protein